ncbi:Fasciclin-like arabinogalactan protein 9 [Abeliophyllum distichum]|uniref:Fasciclin-like arabinogalactan protein 9 n=1 Tax=Abeliophyllum distichum TaxID=126358 RepID=A0ABD1PT79_9LAMI
MANMSFSLILLSLTTIFSLLIPTLYAQSAPLPAPSGPINITGILEKAGQYTTFIRLLNQTQAGNQINSQVNSSNEGMTVFAPTDNAFLNLPSGTLNNLSAQQQVQLVQYHVLPKYYTLENLQTVSNPVRTQATGQDGGFFGLNFTGQGNQVNVSTGIVDVPIYNALRKDFPLAVYQVDKVLLPLEFYQAKAPAASPPAAANGTKSDTGDKKTPDAPSPANGSGKMSMEFGLVSGLWLMLFYLM